MPRVSVAMVASEVEPFSKTGGMGDVTGSLAVALARAGHRVMTVSPRYREVDPARFGLSDPVHVVRAHAGQWEQTAGLRVCERDGVTHVLVENGLYDRVGIYGDDHGAFGDNHIRYALLCRAALEAVRRVPVGGALLGEDVVLHGHDWQGSLLPIYLEALYHPLGLLERASTVLTVHNPAHQGRLPAWAFPDLELAPRWMADWALEYHGDLGLLKAGIIRADELTTVSPTFAWEVTTEIGGFGLDGLLRARAERLTGVVNGIDTAAWDPATDPHLTAHYSGDDTSGKAACKAAIQRELGLPELPDAPLFGSVGRLDPQKGIELLVDSVPWLAASGAQLVLLGAASAAHRAYERQLRDLERAFPDHVRAWIGFSDGVAHRIQAGADLYLMPSLFEPCGLSQLFALRYGTVPVVRSTGGLADTVSDHDPAQDTGTGFVFHRPTAHTLRDALWRAISLYREEPEAFARMRARGMAVDNSWESRVGAYEAIYRRAASRRATAERAP